MVLAISPSCLSIEYPPASLQAGIIILHHPYHYLFWQTFIYSLSVSLQNIGSMRTGILCFYSSLYQSLVHSRCSKIFLKEWMNFYIFTQNQHGAVCKSVCLWYVLRNNSSCRKKASSYQYNLAKAELHKVKHIIFLQDFWDPFVLWDCQCALQNSRGGTS